MFVVLALPVGYTTGGNLMWRELMWVTVEVRTQDFFFQYKPFNDFNVSKWVPTA